MNVAQAIAVLAELGNRVFPHQPRDRHIHADLEAAGVGQEPVLFLLALDGAARVRVVGDGEAERGGVVDQAPCRPTPGDRASTVEASR